MAVYTFVSAKDLAQYLTCFDIGTLVAFEGIADGVENTNYRLTTTKGDFILTLFEKRVREEDIPFYIAFMAHLHSKAIPCPEVLRVKKCFGVVPLNKKPAIITTFLKGRSPQFVENFHAASVGEILARMHLAEQDFNMRRDNAMSLPAWRGLIGSCDGKTERVEQGLFPLLQKELEYQENNWPRHLPAGVIHADLFPDNVFFVKRELTGVIDFYFSCTEAFAYDLMLTVNAWCFDAFGKMEVRKFNELLAAYQKIRALTAHEMKSLPFFGRASALRIIATRLYDGIHQDPAASVTLKDPLEYVRILKFYQAGCFPA